MWLDWLVFCDYGFSVSALWCPLATPTICLGFLLPRTWGISSQLLQQSAAAAPYIGRGVSPHCRPSWPWTWSGSPRPSCAHAATAPWMWGCFSRLPPLTSGGGELLPAATAGLGRGVVPSGHWWDIYGETVETVSDFLRGGSKITADSDCSHEIQRCLLLGRKVMTNLDSIFKRH